MTARLSAARTGPVAAGEFLVPLGDPGGRLFAGPPDPEPLEAHLTRLGPVPRQPADDLLEAFGNAGLLGRGGAEFPFAAKLRSARKAGGAPIVVANGSEGEPASRKDAVLLANRPHLVLDGLELAAAVTGASESVIYVHPPQANALALAVGERRRCGLGPPGLTVRLAPDRFVAGESSAVVAFLETGAARPRRSKVPAAVSGFMGRPTVVSNVETLAHAALIGRFGPTWFRLAGSPAAPGSSLVTLAGAVSAPGQVLELLRPCAVDAVLEMAGLSAPPPAVLFGGYGGRWVGGTTAWSMTLDRGLFRSAGVPLGCGLVAPLAPGACGLRATYRLLWYLAEQSSGQCGPCVNGLGSLADDVGALVDGVAGRRELRRIGARCHALVGAGGCAHPDGAVHLVESAMAVFADDVALHLKGASCLWGRRSGWFPVSRSSDEPR